MPVTKDTRIWLGVKEGKFVSRVDGNDDILGSMLTGHLMNITFKSHEKGKVLQLHIIDETDYFVLGLFTNSYYAKAFLMMMKNIDLKEPLTITVRQKVEDGKKKGSLFISQDGLPLKWYWNKDNRGDLPQMVQEVVQTPQGPKEVWNDRDQMAYLELVLEQDIIPMLKKKLNPYPSNSNYSGNTGNEIAGNYFGKEERYRTPGPVSSTERNASRITEPVDDLPF